MVSRAPELASQCQELPAAAISDGNHAVVLAACAPAVEPCHAVMRAPIEADHVCYAGVTLMMAMTSAEQRCRVFVVTHLLGRCHAHVSSN